MKDNSTGKDKEFYELGKKMFDRLNPPKPEPEERNFCPPVRQTKRRRC